MEPTPLSPRGRVLVVDDSAVARALVRSCLSAFDLDEADGATEALRKLRESHFDVVVTDLRMPGLDGFGLLTAVKGAPSSPEVVILTSAASRDVGNALKAYRLGAYDFLTKTPSRPEELTMTVKKAVEKKRRSERHAASSRAGLALELPPWPRPVVTAGRVLPSTPGA